MRRYFFDLRDENGLVPDEEGLLLANLEAVQDEAARALGGFANDEARTTKSNGNLVRELAIEVRDESGPVLLASFSFQIKRLQ